MASAMMKPQLLFISPILPSPDGPGLAMRPYFQIVSLSHLYDIHLLVATDWMYEKPANDGRLKADCVAIDYIARLRFSGWKFSLWHRGCRMIDQLRCRIKGAGPLFHVDLGDGHYLRHHPTLARLAGMKFERVHVFRLYLSHVADVLKKQGLRAYYSMDVDDIESETRRSISSLLFANGEVRKAEAMSRESNVYFNLENRIIPAYKQIFTCSGHDRTHLEERFPGKIITVLPNVVPLADQTRSLKADPIFTLLFVGTMGYYPNADAVRFFASHITPVLRAKSPMPWQLRVVGTPPGSEWIGRFAGHSEIQFAGWVGDLSREYDDADMVVVPIRGGGGTRIKILEAFAHGVPVVSTVKGAEGLDVENGMHLLMEDDPERFATACLQLMNNREMRNDMSRRALDLVKTKYSPQAIIHAWTGQGLEPVT